MGIEYILFEDKEIERGLVFCFWLEFRKIIFFFCFGVFGWFLVNVDVCFLVYYFFSFYLYIECIVFGREKNKDILLEV